MLAGLSHRAPGSATERLAAAVPVSVVVDSGTTLSLLPEPAVAALAQQFTGAKADGRGGYTVPCDHQARDGSVDFLFGPGGASARISVSYRDFIWRSGSRCFLGAWYTPDVGVYILGDSFLRGAYGKLRVWSHHLTTPGLGKSGYACMGRHILTMIDTQSPSTRTTAPSTWRITPRAIPVRTWSPYQRAGMQRLRFPARAKPPPPDPQAHAPPPSPAYQASVRSKPLHPRPALPSPPRRPRTATTTEAGCPS